MLTLSYSKVQIISLDE